MKSATRKNSFSLPGAPAYSRLSQEAESERAVCRLAIEGACLDPGRRASQAAFTLAEVLAALLFMAIVIPVAVEGLHIASLAGAVAARKGPAARIALQVLDDNLVNTNWTQTLQGTTTENQRA